jgi:hypothetical protein
MFFAPVLIRPNGALSGRVARVGAVPRVETLGIIHNLSAGSGCPAQLWTVWKSIARRYEQNTGWKPMLLYAVSWLPWVRGLRQDVLERSLDTPESNIV